MSSCALFNTYNKGLAGWGVMVMQIVLIYSLCIFASDTPLYCFDLCSLLLLYGPVFCYKWRCWEGQNIKGQTADTQIHRDTPPVLLHTFQQLCFRTVTHPLRARLQRLCSCVTNHLNIRIVQWRIDHNIFISGLSHIFRSLHVLFLGNDRLVWLIWWLSCCWMYEIVLVD